MAFLQKRLGNWALTPISAALKPGDLVKAATGRTLFVLARVDQGKRGVVYEVTDSDGARYALKVAKDHAPDTLASLAKEGEKAELYQKYGIPHAKVVEAGEGYVLKDWIQGTRADELMKDWQNRNGPMEPPGARELRKLIQSAAQKGVYIGDLNSKNLIWTGYQEGWFVVDSGGIREGVPIEEAFKRYAENISTRWAKSACDPEKIAELLKATLLKPQNQP